MRMIVQIICMTKNIASIRKEYSLKQLDQKDVRRNPFDQFKVWFDDAINAEVNEPNAMMLATSSLEGKPSARMVLLKGFDNEGLTFFTNYSSRKASQLNSNPYAAIVFFWPELERQIRIEGIVKKVTERESDDYFDSRPEGSRIGAWTSPQSQVIPNREFLELLRAEIEKRFKGEKIPRPKQWGGFMIIPSLFEFWQGRPNRLHDRIQYSKTDNNWIIERLAP